MIALLGLVVAELLGMAIAGVLVIASLFVGDDTC